jgi:thymidylate synthase
MVLGVPFDLFQAGVLAHLIAREVSYTAGRYITATKLIWTAGDAHVYTNQLEAAKTILQQARDMPPMRAKIELPNSLELRLLNGSLTAGHIHVTDYVAAAPVSAPIAI